MQERERERVERGREWREWRGEKNVGEEKIVSLPCNPVDPWTVPPKSQPFDSKHNYPCRKRKRGGERRRGMDGWRGREGTFIIPQPPPTKVPSLLNRRSTIDSITRQTFQGPLYTPPPSSFGPYTPCTHTAPMAAPGLLGPLAIFFLDPFIDEPGP